MINASHSKKFSSFMGPAGKEKKLHILIRRQLEQLEENHKEVTQAPYLPQFLLEDSGLIL